VNEAEQENGGQDKEGKDDGSAMASEDMEVERKEQEADKVEKANQKEKEMAKDAEETAKEKRTGDSAATEELFTLNDEQANGDVTLHVPAANGRKSKTSSPAASPLRSGSGTSSPTPRSPSLASTEASSSSLMVIAVEEVASVEEEPAEPAHPPFELDVERLQRVHEILIKHTEKCSIDSLLALHAKLKQIIYQHRREWNRTPLLTVRYAKLLLFCCSLPIY
jgi:hypothetical protein